MKETGSFTAKRFSSFTAVNKTVRCDGTLSPIDMRGKMEGIEKCAKHIVGFDLSIGFVDSKKNTEYQHLSVKKGLQCVS